MTGLSDLRSSANPAQIIVDRERFRYFRLPQIGRFTKPDINSRSLFTAWISAAGGFQGWRPLSRHHYPVRIMRIVVRIAQYVFSGQESLYNEGRSRGSRLGSRVAIVPAHF